MILRKKLLHLILEDLYKQFLFNQISTKAIELRIKKQPELQEEFNKALAQLEGQLNVINDQIEIVKKMLGEKE